MQDSNCNLQTSKILTFSLTALSCTAEYVFTFVLPISALQAPNLSQRSTNNNFKVMHKTTVTLQACCRHKAYSNITKSKQ